MASSRSSLPIDLSRLDVQGLVMVVRAILRAQGQTVWVEWSGVLPLLELEDHSGARQLGLCIVASSADQLRARAKEALERLQKPESAVAQRLTLFTHHRVQAKSVTKLETELSSPGRTVHVVGGAQLEAWLTPELRESLAPWLLDAPYLDRLCTLAKLPPEAQALLLQRLQMDLLAAQYPRLASMDRELQLPLAQVFTDLPIERWNLPQLERQHRRPALHRLAPALEFEFGASKFALRRLIALGNRSNRLSGGTDQRLPGLESPALPTVVVEGGPGQGKSTLLQYLCQLQRGQLLQGQLVTSAVASVLKVQAEASAESGILLSCRRLPLTVELASFARALSQDPALSVEGYLATRLSVRPTKQQPGRPFLPEWLSALFRSGPILLVLDGLDEVPASANRLEVLRQLEAFLKGLPADVDLQLVCTTRPQGYQGEFHTLLASSGTRRRPSQPPEDEDSASAGALEHWRLTPLTPDLARAYAEKLLQTRFALNLPRLEILLERLHDALESSTTHALTGSPLQVTLLCSLLEEGRPPAERWKLFRAFYDTLFKREQEKELPSVAVLRSHAPLVHALHREVGFRLHVASERASATDARLTQEQFQRLVDILLTQQGFEDPERTRLSDQLRTVALERLVLLVSPEEGWLGFEVRSIQEFFAASFLVEDQDLPVIRERLRPLLVPSHWENVLRMAVGYLAERKPEGLAQLPEMLQALKQDPAHVAAASSARIADALLGEDVFQAHPKVHRALGELALEGVERVEGYEEEHYTSDNLEMNVFREPRIHERCVSVLKAGLEDPGREAFYFDLLLRAPDEIQEHLLTLERVSNNWLAVVQWQNDQMDTGERHRLNRPMQFLVRTTSNDRFRFPLLSERFLARLQRFVPEFAEPLQPFQIPHPRAAVRLFGEHFVILRSTSFLMDCQFLYESGPKLPFEHPRLHPDWQYYALAKAFARAPSARALAEALRQAPHTMLPVELPIPWPLGACLEHPDRLRLADAADAGLLGDLADWLEAEARWTSIGLVLADAIYIPEGSLPFDRNVGRIGFPTIDIVLETLRPFEYIEIPHTTTWAPWFFDLYLKTKFQFKNMYLSISSVLRHPDPIERIFGLTYLIHEPEVWPHLHEQLLTCNPVLFYGNLIDPHTASNVLQLRPDLDSMLVCVAEPTDLEERRQWKSDKPLPLPPSVDVDPDHHTHPRVKLACYALSIKSGLPYDLTALEALLLSVPEERGLFWSMCRSDELRDVGLLTLMVRVLPVGSPQLYEAALILWRALIKHPSAFQDPAMCRALGLPLPDDAAPEEGGSTSPTVLPQLARLAIQHFRGIQALELSFAPREGGQWTFLIGDNGVGKTSILRALALALFPEPAPSALLGLLPRPSIRLGQSTARVEVKLHAHPTAVSIQLSPAAGGEKVRIASPLPPLFAAGYGVLRGQATKSGESFLERNSPLWPLRSLAHAGPVENAERWLRDQHAEALRAPQRHGPVWDDVQAILKEVLMLDALEVQEDFIWVENALLGRVPFTTLSDGYQTTAGWVCDLLSLYLTWSRQQRDTPPLEHPFQAHMRGLVLLDELDLHLHPRWQAGLVPRLRKTFPQLSFVVTTHNPLTLLGARSGEVFRLFRDSEGTIQVDQTDPPPGASADALLTGQWFGLVSARSEETQALLEQYRQALRAAPSSLEVTALEQTLRERLGTFADSSLERLAWQVAAQLMQEEVQELTQESREALRSKVLEALRKRRAES